MKLSSIIEQLRHFHRRSYRFLAQKLNSIVLPLLLKDFSPGACVQAGVYLGSPHKISLGPNVLVTTGSYAGCELDDGWLQLELDVQVNNGVKLDFSGGLYIGEKTVISQDVLIYTHDHGRNPRSIPKGIPKRIGKNVWIGSRSIILPGCKEIGDGAIVGAGSVVVHDILPGEIVAGNPAKTISSSKNK